MSETQRPLGDDRPTGPEPVGLASGPQPAAATRTVLAKGQRVPWPRRLIATGLLAAVLALALHALPRPYQTLPTGVVRGLGDSYGNLRSSYKNEVAALEPVAGEASAADRNAYARELWRYRWLGSFREILLRFSEWLAASCMVIALSMIAVERRRSRRELAARGATTAPVVLRHETLAGDSIGAEPPPPASLSERPLAAPLPPSSEATPPFPMTPRMPLRETGDEVTPPSPTPVPKIGALDLRPATFDDSDDLGRTTEGQVLNLARLPVQVPPAPSASSVETAKPLPVFFAERRHPEPHPVVHPGDPPPPAEPMPAPADESNATRTPDRSAPPVAASESPKPEAVPPLPRIDEESLPVWLRKP